ncbi:MAG: hypothetical protein MK102_11180 [Fuerstiella sp.]|nr:hypothetical protein [Fuerstiella sp.]
MTFSGVCFVVAGLAQGQPSLSNMAPQGLLPGQTTNVTIRGDNLTKPVQLWSPSSIKIEEITVADDSKSLTCRMTAGSDCPIGIVGLVAANVSGVTNPILLMVDDLDSVADNTANHSIADAQEVPTAIAVDGVFDGPKSDFYRVSLKGGQLIAVEVVSQRIASLLDPVLRVLDAKGNELMIMDDSPGFGADCHLLFQAAESGDYILEVRDNRYRRGGTYRMRIGDFPILTSPYPMGGRLGATTQFRFTGQHSDEPLSLIKYLPVTVAENQLAISVKRSDGVSSAMAKIAVSELPEFTETEPNNHPEDGVFVTVPCAVSGVLNTKNDQDHFEFALAKGQRIDCVGESRRYGSHALVHMQLIDAAGRSVAETSINDSDDSQFTYTAADAGVFRLAVRDLIYRGGESFAYRVAIRTGADYSLTLKHADKTTVRVPVPVGDRALALTVSAQRRGYAGPIRLKIREPGPELDLYNQTIPAGKDETRLYAVIPSDSKEGEFWPLRFVGIAEIDGREIQRAVTTEATVRSTIPQLAYPYPWLDGLFTVGVVAAVEPFFAMTCEAAEHTIVSGSQLPIPLKLERRDKEFKGAVQVFADRLPVGCRIDVKSEEDVYTVTVSCAGDVPEGNQTARLVVIGEHSGRTQTFVQDVVLRIVRPDAPSEGKESAETAG